jgi:hypothetical protein
MPVASRISLVVDRSPAYEVSPSSPMIAMSATPTAMSHAAGLSDGRLPRAKATTMRYETTNPR